MQLLRIELGAEESALAALARFYGNELGLPIGRRDSALGVRIGATTLDFRAVPGDRPFYHFALRVPRNRFAAARAWLAKSAELLPEPGTPETTFEFPNWNAVACYAHDPCGNIVELIAHMDLPDESPASGAFAGGELSGVCELGLVGPDARAMADALEPLGIRLWDGTVDVPGRLAFLGGPDGTLILAPAGRGWMPTGRPAEVHPSTVVAHGDRVADVAVPGTRSRVQTTVAYDDRDAA